MGEKEVNVEGAGGIEHLDSGSEGSPLARIGSPLSAFVQVKEQFRRACSLSYGSPLFLPPVPVRLFRGLLYIP